MSYDNLEQTLTILKENLPKALLPFDLPQLAELCRRGEVTPLFYYGRYAIEVKEYLDKPKAADEKVSGFYSGYLTHERLINLLYNNKNELFFNSAIAYEEQKTDAWNGACYEIVLKANDVNLNRFLTDENYNLYKDDDSFLVTRESLLFPREQVQNYIASKQTTEQKNPEQQRVIEALNDTPANSVTHSNTEIQNVKKAAIRHFNKSLATVLIELDYQDKLRKSDIAKYIMPYMKELAFILADEDEKKAANLTVSYDTLYDTHLKGMNFKAGRQSNQEKERGSIELLFKKELPATE